MDGIRIDGVTKRYRRGEQETIALAEVSIDVAPGEFIAIVGPSGCGKSTLLRLVAGLHAPSSGEITVSGQKVNGPVTEVGIVFQSPVLLDWRNTLGNVLFQADIRGLPVREFRAARAGTARGRWASRTSPIAIRTSCRAACASARRSRARCCTTRRCC